ncbi:ring-h2 finger protein atl56 [Anaeramoeba flamelloides]|uniref:Ring-h2 finger protein atl56 n=1 Tax=Anaeramoeba flamelloides TaxID=1746091 RepID=A0ABQ8Z8V9_9EUKA|nr:ring-h2 finger protein atl56 [Anaeramoeba flamelloides]
MNLERLRTFFLGYNENDHFQTEPTLKEYVVHYLNQINFFIFKITNTVKNYLDTLNLPIETEMVVGILIILFFVLLGAIVGLILRLIIKSKKRSNRNKSQTVIITGTNKGLGNGLLAKLPKKQVNKQNNEQNQNKKIKEVECFLDFKKYKNKLPIGYEKTITKKYHFVSVPSESKTEIPHFVSVVEKIIFVLETQKKMDEQFNYIKEVLQFKKILQKEVPVMILLIEDKAEPKKIVQKQKLSEQLDAKLSNDERKLIQKIVVGTMQDFKIAPTLYFLVN